VTDPTLAGLDDEQRAVAECLHGPVVVLAGAGSGKTRAITHRIAHGVRTGEHDPRRSMAVTFTTRAAGEMGARLAALGVAGVQVRTFHAAALRQLRHFWPRLAGGEFPDILPSKARLVAEAARRCGLDTNPATVRDLTSDIEWAKVSDTEDVAALAVATGRVLTVETATFTRLRSAYEDIKDGRGLIDFEDVLLLAVGALESRPDLATEVRTAYRWFTVDEFQDVNALQYRLLRLWLGERDDVCVVGDAQQTIYTFTGATSRYLEEFGRVFPDATEVRLERCYRCVPGIVDLANRVIAQAPDRGSSLVLRSMRPAGERPTVHVYDDDIAEAEAVVARVRGYLADGRSPRDVAVLFRINAQSAVLEEAFAEAGIPVLLRGSERFFDRPEVREAVTRIRGAARAEVDAGVDQVRDVLSAMGWSDQPPTSAGAVRERWESLAALVALADEVGPLTLGAFVQELDARAQAQHAPMGEGVTLSSIHAAKGLEWPVVFVVGVSDGLLPLRQADSVAALAEERRLAYVAITRAADRLHLSWARARQPGGRAGRSPSPFLDVAEGVHDSAGASVRRGSGTRREEKRRRGPARCRECGRALVTGRESTLGRCEGCPAGPDTGLYDTLREWRREVSRSGGVPAFVVFTDVTLQAIAERRPADLDALLAIPGVGPAKLEAYGAQVLAIVANESA
jgi:DNA helicase-2/ATP-dependent DNA helicase PcrA